MFCFIYLSSTISRLKFLLKFRRGYSSDFSAFHTLPSSFHSLKYHDFLLRIFLRGYMQGFPPLIPSHPTWGPYLPARSHFLAIPTQPKIPRRYTSCYPEASSTGSTTTPLFTYPEISIHLFLTTILTAPNSSVRSTFAPASSRRSNVSSWG